MIDPERIWSSPRLPTLPTVAVRLLELSRNPKAGVREFVELIRSDPATAAKILKAANSSYFGLAVPVTSLDRAVPLLGTTVVTSLALSFSLTQWQSHPRGTVDSYRAYWLQSVVQAAAAESLASKQNLAPDCDLFLAALLADIGQLAMLKAVPDEYGPVLEASRNGMRPLDDVERECLGLTHVEVGVRLASEWRLPEPLVSAIRFHHTSVERLQNESHLPHSDVIKAVATAAAVGEYYCSLDKATALERLWTLGRELFGLTPLQLQRSLDEIHHRVDQAGELLSIDTSRLPSPEELMVEASEQLAQLTIREHIVNTQAAARCQAAEKGGEILTPGNSQWHQQSLRDSLTGLHNSQYFEAALSQEIQQADRHGVPVGVLCADIDDLKRINDTYGLRCGDAVLQHVGRRLGQALRGSDVLSHRGGGEFLILANQPTENALRTLSERLRTQVESEPFELDGQRVRATISTGAALALPARSESDLASRLVSAANEAMHRAKQAGKNGGRVESLLSDDQRRLLKKVNYNRFSRWLASRGEFDVPVLSRILLKRPHERVAIGELARKRGYLTGEQTDEILRNQEHNGLRFGETALTMRLLTEDQLAHLLALQLESPVVLARALVSAGLTDQRRASGLLKQYLAETVPTTSPVRRAVTLPS